MLRTPGLSTEPGVIHNAGSASSGYQAINLALLLGATRVLLLGYDMQHDGRRAHWFGDHPRAISSGNLNPTHFVETYREMRPENYGLEVINCSRRTALDAFPRMALEDVAW